MNVTTRATAAGRHRHIVTLEDVVVEWRKTIGGEHDPIVQMCREAKSLRHAVAIACACRQPDGKRYAMESNFRHATLQALEAAMVENMPRMRRCDTFDELHDLMEAIRPKGIGVLATYNMSRRVGAILGLAPQDFLYLHAGPAKGWRALTGRKAPIRVPMTEVPWQLRTLTPCEIEDLLCEFRDLLNPRML